VKNFRRVIRKQYSAEEKIRIVLDGLRGESSIAELRRREGIAEVPPRSLSFLPSLSSSTLAADKTNRWPFQCNLA
jgi:hypothetical protein